jgi:hypothetical protein
LNAEELKTPDPENIWEAIQTITGDTYVYHKGFKEEANIKDVVKVAVGFDKDQIVLQATRFDFNPLKPSSTSTIRINRTIIAFAWFVDPFCEIIVKLKEKMQEMDAARAGIILPGRR